VVWSRMRGGAWSGDRSSRRPVWIPPAGAAALVARARRPGRRCRVCHSGAQAALGHNAAGWKAGVGAGRAHGGARQAARAAVAAGELGPVEANRRPGVRHCWPVSGPEGPGAHAGMRLAAAASESGPDTAARARGESRGVVSIFSFEPHLSSVLHSVPCPPAALSPSVWRAVACGTQTRAPSMWRAVACGTQLHHRLGLAPSFCRAPLLAVRPAVPCRAPASGRGFCE